MTARAPRERAKHHGCRDAPSIQTLATTTARLGLQTTLTQVEAHILERNTQSYQRCIQGKLKEAAAKEKQIVAQLIIFACFIMSTSKDQTSILIQ
jgi:hypothetical protein